MTPIQTESVKRFSNDPIMSEAVYTLLRNFFLKRKKVDDVQMLASERLALFLLEDAWREIERMSETEKEAKELGNVGL